MKMILPSLHERQLELRNSRDRFAVVSCGRRWGKTRKFAVRQLGRAYEGRLCWWVVPSYNNPSRAVAQRMFEIFADQIPGAVVNRSERNYSFPSGGSIYLKTADTKGGLRGEGLDDVVFDEAAHIANLKDIWEQEVRAALMDRKGGASFVSTPNGMNYFKELYDKGTKGERNWSCHQYSSYTNPFLDNDEIADLVKDMPDLVKRQEIDAEFVQLAGALFKREYFTVVDSPPPFFMSQARFWDLAASTKTTADYTVGCKMAIGPNGNLWILDVVRGRWTWPDAIKVIRSTALADGTACMQLIEQVGTQKGMVDIISSEPELGAIGVSGVTVTKDKLQRAMPFLARCEQGRVKVLSGPWTVDFVSELCAFPQGDHDDQVDAASGAMTGLGGGALSRSDISDWTQELGDGNAYSVVTESETW